MKLIFTLSILFVFQCSFSQYMPPQRISTPYGNATIPGYGFPHGMHFYNYSSLQSLKHEFIIEMLDSTLITSKTKIKFNDSTSYLEFKKDKKKLKIIPSQTKGIYWYHYTGRKMLGIPQDSCWLFLVNKSKISTYSTTAEIGKLAFETHIQKGEDGAIVALSKKNLEPMVYDNPKALLLVNKKKLLKAIKEYNKAN